MKRDIPKIYVNNIGRIYNNEEVYYSYKDNNSDVCISSPYDMRNKIDEIFRANDFIYKKSYT